MSQTVSKASEVVFTVFVRPLFASPRFGVDSEMLEKRRIFWHTVNEFMPSQVVHLKVCFPKAVAKLLEHLHDVISGDELRASGVYSEREGFRESQATRAEVFSPSLIEHDVAPERRGV